MTEKVKRSGSNVLTKGSHRRRGFSEDQTVGSGTLKNRPGTPKGGTMQMHLQELVSRKPKGWYREEGSIEDRVSAVTVIKRTEGWANEAKVAASF